MKKSMKLLICTLLSLMLCISCTLAGFAAELRFSDDGKFTILQITDTQDDHHPSRDMLDLVRVSIEQTKPDLVVFTGDIVEDKRVGDLCVDDEPLREGVVAYNGTKVDVEQTRKNVRIAVDAVFSIVNEAGIPFAVTQGNNDYKCSVDNSEWLEIYSGYENCLVTDLSDDSDGRIDYNIGIHSSDGDKLLFNLYMMDTRSGGVTDEQIAWYEAESNVLKARNGNEAVPSFVFEHVPVAEVSNLFESCELWDEGAIVSGFNCYRLKDGVTGYASNVQIPGGSSTQFESWKRQGDVVGAYFGHWHTDGYTGIYDGIELGLTYGSEFAKKGPYGVRVITLDENNIADYENELYIYSDGELMENAPKPGFFQTILQAIISFFTGLSKIFN